MRRRTSVRGCADGRPPACPQSRARATNAVRAELDLDGWKALRTGVEGGIRTQTAPHTLMYAHTYVRAYSVRLVQYPKLQVERPWVALSGRRHATKPTPSPSSSTTPRTLRHREMPFNASAYSSILGPKRACDSPNAHSPSCEKPACSRYQPASRADPRASPERARVPTSLAPERFASR